METVVRVFTSYPTFLWITWCKILFIASDQIWKTWRVVAQYIASIIKLSFKSLCCINFTGNGKLADYGGKLLSIF
ncbi:hypothetical protein GA0061070_100499 [Kosakonia oryziphila]|uniref:Uncharacterized protein n=1 Tax=Kosakonia oryziphila TaxID=1005667 RepID=A0A1C4AFD5_9ENTR|nr:hypothetical protein GA0061070_100499 [Kosakonia oryziphila]